MIVSDENRQRLFLFLSMAVVIGWYAFVTPPSPKKPSHPPEAASPAATETAGTVAPPAAELNATDGAAPAAVDEPEKLIFIDGPLYTAKLSTYGGVIRSFQLKGYESDDRNGLKDIISAATTHPPLFAAIEGLPAAAEGDQLPYSYDGPLTFSLGDGQSKADIQLTHRTADGVIIVKQIVFPASTYGIRAEYRALTAEGSASRKLRPIFRIGLDNARLPHSDTSRMGTHALVSAAGTKRHEFKDLKEKEIKVTEDPHFAGFEDHYFLTAILPDNPKYTALNILATGQTLWETRAIGPEILAGTGVQNAEVSGATFYLGPKSDAALIAVNPALESAINYGFGQTLVKPIAKFLLSLLRIFHGVVGDWGYSILLLTLIVRIGLFPLAIKQYHSMQAMAKLKPRMEELKAKFGDDKLGLNQATMELFREHQVNPLSGCLPVLPQIPIFLGLYVSLDTSLELRHALFAGTWIHDLSVHDPLYILPILTCATMALSMKLTPSQMDPTQQKIMMIMPVVMFFLFMKIAAGLVLYWSASNVFSIAQQLYFNSKTKALGAAGPQAPPKVVETTATEVTGSGKKKLKN